MHTHKLTEMRTWRTRGGILTLVFCTLVSVHSMQLAGWLLTDSRIDQPSIMTPHTAAPSSRAVRILRRLAKLATMHTQELEIATKEASVFPPPGTAVFPVGEVPDWGAMTGPDEWNRRFEDMPTTAFVPVPAYDLEELTRPLHTLLQNRRANKDIITAKLTYSTRYFGAYDIDADEFTGNHPGLDIKLAEGTPIGAITGGRVSAVSDRKGLGRTVIVEHHLSSDEVIFSVYGHLATTTVRAGQTVIAGQILGTVGMTGNTTAPHLHLQIDRGEAGQSHTPYVSYGVPTPEVAARFSIHPITFIEQFGPVFPQETVVIDR